MFGNAGVASSKGATVLWLAGAGSCHCSHVTCGKVQAGLLLLVLDPVHLGVPAAPRSSCRQFQTGAFS